ncbi:sigma-70 family RNA polymerase sigma factor [Paludibaculum fermentans]|uniref:Sigma-70 family RNA polymerase sigma factor n=1 Tax=Paludibaculum fermentans TaxID=1473598 RepID=A0A7S7NQH9_PALFE|nr:sigma-70 family RNA polymerase sigma factor [Paludibaculum fermentans]
MQFSSGPADFPTTHWTLVAAAGAHAGPDSRQALASLCEAYWFPLYAYARRRGDSPEAAQDHTQEFFARFLERDYFDRADPDRGRFRSFLLSSFKYYLCDEAGRARAQKRGGGMATLPFEFSKGEEMYVREPVHNETPERIYERRWARTLLDRVVDRLREEFILLGRLEHFNNLKPCLQGEFDVPYAELARRLETTEAALKVGIHRLRKRYRDLLRSEIANIVADPADIDAELRHLIAALAGKS